VDKDDAFALRSAFRCCGLYPLLNLTLLLG
jgi:hypothetical protein